MKLAPTLQGGLRIDVENPLDLMVLRGICTDARGAAGFDLAGTLSAGMAADPGIEDWRDYVLPDLKEGFDTQLDVVETALAAALCSAGGDDFEDGVGPVEIHIRREDGEAWYGALNHARLALEEKYGFSEADPAELSPGLRSAWFRGQFYLQVQSLLLDHVMR